MDGKIFTFVYMNELTINFLLFMFEVNYQILLKYMCFWDPIINISIH